MRCGICGSDKPTYENRGFLGTAPPTIREVNDAGDLVTHKRQQHPEEYQASLQQRKATKAAHEYAERDYLQRRGEAGRAAGREVLHRWPYGDTEPRVTITANVSTFERLSDYRYPEPVAFREYNSLQREIKRLTDLAAAALRDAFEKGAPIPQEDVDRVRAAMDAVPVTPS